MEKIKNNRILFELIVGIILFGIICQIGLNIYCAVKLGRHLYYSLGLLIGTIIAILYGIHMNNSISNAISFDKETAIKIARKDSVLRYTVLVIVLAIFMIFDVVSPISMILGVFGLKIGAYINPFVHKLTILFIPDESANLKEQGISNEISDIAEDNNI